ncbi:MAG: hypothetical protein BWY46_01378 [Firmicutes bacterium ADurb.Bin300]|nr:MAG: hypothetical protein BWY46_01378 [Firmicutes bacterium ADurb.Bin300]
MATTIRYAKLKDPHGVEFAPKGMTQGQLSEGGYLPYEETEKPTGIHNYKPVYSVSNNKVIRGWEAYPNFAEIERLKKRLAETDYKIIKCYECSLTNQPAPYDIVSVHAERQAIRNQINSLEECE